MFHSVGGHGEQRIRVAITDYNSLLFLYNALFLVKNLVPYREVSCFFKKFLCKALIPFIGIKGQLSDKPKLIFGIAVCELFLIDQQNGFR